MNKIKILRLNEVIYITGLSRSTIYLRMSDGAFPKSINLGGRAVGWSQEEIETWCSDKINSRNLEA